MAALAFSVPILAKTVRATLDTMPATIADAHLKAGEYTFVIKDNQLIVFRTDDGKVVAKDQGEWKDSEQKSDQDELVLDSDHVAEIHFAHKTEYFVLN